ncbi:RidA family protein [Mesorhizobium sp. CAU 1741]|uniref:RidA family protein n=1 Tax=Mesorhizobium sp. CAU 1741 TaxID=3140366 RepID=UPI00325C08DD
MALQRYPGNKRMSAAVAHGDTLYLKGVTPRDTDGEIETQTQDVLDQIDALLLDAGSGRDKVVKVMIWITDIRNFERMNSVYDQWIVAGSEPVRACVEARLADPKMKVEIQVEAAL